MKRLKDLNICIAAHEYFKGSPQELKDFLINQKISKLTYIAHQFSYLDNSVSYKEVYKDATLVSKEKSSVTKGRELKFYLRDTLYNLKFLFFSKEKYDVYIGVDSFNAFFGVFLKLFGKADTTVFFTIDYIMHGRFTFPLFNLVYVFLDRLAFFSSDYTWNVSGRMSTQRIYELGEIAKRKNQIVVPIGVPINETRDINVPRRANVLVYSGSLMPEFGLEILVQALPLIALKIPDVELRILGGGPLESVIKNLATELNVEKNLNFIGYINTLTDRVRWLTLLKESTLGMAMYEPTKNTYKKFSDVTKPKDYMACGLPIITTSVIPISEDIEKFNLGRVVDFNKESLAQSVIELLQDKMELSKISQAVQDYGKDSTWENIYKRAFKEMRIVNESIE